MPSFVSSSISALPGLWRNLFPKKRLQTGHAINNRPQGLGIPVCLDQSEKSLAPCKCQQLKNLQYWPVTALSAFLPQLCLNKREQTNKTPFHRHTLQDPVLTAAGQGLEEGRQSSLGFFIPIKPDLLAENTVAAPLPSFTFLWRNAVPAPVSPPCVATRGVGEAEGPTCLRELALSHVPSGVQPQWQWAQPQRVKLRQPAALRAAMQYYSRAIFWIRGGTPNGITWKEAQGNNFLNFTSAVLLPCSVQLLWLLVHG